LLYFSFLHSAGISERGYAASVRRAAFYSRAAALSVAFFLYFIFDFDIIEIIEGLRLR